MMSSSCLLRQLRAALWLCFGLFSSATVFAQPNYAIFLDSYPSGRFHLIEIPDLDARNVKTVRPEPLDLDLSRGKLRRFQMGNGDVHVDPTGRRVIFGGRIGNNGDWDVYEAELDIARRRLDGVQPMIANRGVREEDPRFSWDGSQIVYKCSGKICLYPYYSQPVAERKNCELWAPAIDFTGFVIAYVERCGDADSDRIVRYSIPDRVRTEVANVGGGPDRFPHFLQSGEIVYSHMDSETGRVSLWQHTYPDTIELLHDETESDDDPYVYKQDETYNAFIGWQQGGYDLFIYRRDSREAVQLTQGDGVLGPIIFP